MPAQSPTDARIAALEAQVAALTARLAGPAAPPAIVDEEPCDRRSLLRRGTLALAAGVAGAVALPAPARAGEGDPVLAGRTNDAGAATTALSGGAQAAPTLELVNRATASSDGVAVAGPSLRLAPSPATGGLDAARASAGDLASSGDLLHYAHVSSAPDAPAVVGTVYTSAFANHLEFLSTLRRVLDTRPGPATDDQGSPNDRRTRVVAGRFDGSGRLVPGSALVLDLSRLVVGGVGVFANLTVVSPAGPGYLTAYPTPSVDPRTDGLDRPAASSLNYARGTAALANAVVVGLGAGARISVFTTTAAHVLLDLTAVSVREPFGLTESDGVTGALRRR